MTALAYQPRVPYREFLAGKSFVKVDQYDAVRLTLNIHPTLYLFQSDIVRWAVQKRRAAIFAERGMGKTFMYGEYARQLGAPTLILAPRLVVHQAIEKLSWIGMTIRYAMSQEEVDLDVTRYWITNYENVHKFDASKFGTVVLDESSILKQFRGKTKMQLCKQFAGVPNKLCCTATPAPNSVMEIGNHAEFLEIMTSRLMTATYFIHDSRPALPGGDKYRLKKHSVDAFYKWMSSWSIACTKPSDLGYDDTGFELPTLHEYLHTVQAAYTPKGFLPGFGTDAISATDAMRIRKATIAERAEILLDLIQVQKPDEQWLVWTGLNAEDEYLMARIPDAVCIHGGMKQSEQIKAFEAFEQGRARVLITKDDIAGAGVDIQFAWNMAFFGLDYSWEGFYQAVGRMHRHGQTHEVHVHVITSEQERNIYAAVQRKGKESMIMIHELIEASRNYMTEAIKETAEEWTYKTADAESPSGKWKFLLGDSCERLKEIESDSVHLSVYSPPFGSTLFIYSPTERDLGNCRSPEEFMQQYKDYIIPEMLRITMPGRMSCVHIQDTKTYQNREGYRGLYPLSDEIIKAHTDVGWIYRGRITIDKDPQRPATINHDNDLLFETGKQDSTKLAPMNTDYVLLFKKPGENPVPTKSYQNGEMTEEEWILWARAVWYDIRETEVLNVAVAKSNEDEKHLCPLQLPLIERCLKLWSNPGELIFSPFGGIGSEPCVAIKNRRRGLAIELNPTYWRVAQRNLREWEMKYSGPTLFDLQAEKTAS